MARRAGSSYLDLPTDGTGVVIAAVVLEQQNVERKQQFRAKCGCCVLVKYCGCHDQGLKEIRDQGNSGRS
jgi:hypothetical protein